MTQRKIILLIVFALCVFAAWHIGHKVLAPKENTRPDTGPVTVRVTTLTPMDVPIFLSGIGNVTAQNHVVVRSRVDGELMALHFEEGQYVEKGALLAEIDDRVIKAELARAKAEKASAQAQLKTAQMDYKRYLNLKKQDAIATQMVDQQKASVDQLSAAMAVAQAAIDASEVQLAYTRITAPISGYVGIRNVDVGNIVRASDPNGIVALTQTDPVSVIFSLPQSDMAALSPFLQNERKVSVDILTHDDGDILGTGFLQTVDNQIDASSGTFRLKAVIPNEQRLLWPGQFVVARIHVNTLEDVLTVPVNAVERGGDRVFVYRLTDGKAEIVDVDVVYENEQIAVLDTVAQGDKIITDGQMRLKPGLPVQVLGENEMADATQEDAAVSGSAEQGNQE